MEPHRQPERTVIMKKISIVLFFLITTAGTAGVQAFAPVASSQASRYHHTSPLAAASDLPVDDSSSSSSAAAAAAAGALDDPQGESSTTSTSTSTSTAPPPLVAPDTAAATATAIDLDSSATNELDSQSSTTTATTTTSTTTAPLVADASDLDSSSSSSESASTPSVRPPNFDRYSVAVALDLDDMVDVNTLLGIGPETGGKVYDPFDVADMAPLSHLRKAELANGRSAMLATVGWYFPKIWMFPDGPIKTTDPIKAHLEADNQWWAQFIIFCAVIEGIKLRGEMEGKSFTGEIHKEAVLDWTGQWAKMDDGKKADMALKEIKNGRLAMIGWLGFVTNYFLPGSVPVPPGF